MVSFGKLDDLISGSASSDELGPMGGSLHGVLFLAAEVKNGLVDSMCNASDGSSSEEIMAEVCYDDSCSPCFVFSKSFATFVAIAMPHAFALK